MEHKLELSPKRILDEKFTKNVKGYDPGEVDAFLDKVILDYQSFLAYQKESEEYIAHLLERLESEEKKDPSEERNRERISSLEAENASLRNKLSNIRPGDAPTSENLNLIKEINRLSEFLHAIGYDPKTLTKRS